MRNYIDLVENLLNEAGAGPARIVQHIRAGTPFFIISACRAALGAKENAARTDVLKSRLAGLPGVSFIEIDGQYHEDGEEEPTAEKSFFVLPRSQNTNTKKFLEVGRKLMDVFGQEAILTGDGERVSLLHADGHADDIGNVATFDWSRVRDLPGFSMIGDRPFGFTTPDEAPFGVTYGADKSERGRAA